VERGDEALPDPRIENAEMFVGVDEEDYARGEFVEFFGGGAEFLSEAAGGWFEQASVETDDGDRSPASKIRWSWSNSGWRPTK